MTRQLNGITRFRITREWMKRGMPGNLEDFIKTACEALKITYVGKK